MDKATPGPWNIYGTEVTGAVGTSDAKVICRMSYGHVSPAPPFDYLNPKHNDEEAVTQANARLIAAAPDLLAAVKELLDHGVFDLSASDEYPSGITDELANKLERANAAVLKAEGA